MQNRTVPAAAEGLHSITRRDALRTLVAGSAAGVLAAGVLAAGVVIAAPAADAAVSDPLLGLIKRIQKALATVSAMKDVTDEEIDAAMEPVNALYDEIAYRTPPATSEAGAIEALRFAHQTMAHTCEVSNRSLVGAALAYFEGRA